MNLLEPHRHVGRDDDVPRTVEIVVVIDGVSWTLQFSTAGVEVASTVYNSQQSA